MEGQFYKVRIAIRGLIWCSVLFCVVQISGCWSTYDSPPNIKIKVDGNEIRCDGCSEFGRQIELQDDYLFIAEDAALFVFRTYAGQWTMVQEIKYDEKTSVILDFSATSNLLAVGVADLNGSRVDLYVGTSGASWIKFEELRGVNADASFGRSIHIANNRIIIGAPDFSYLVEANNFDYGQAHIYKLDNTKWVLEATLKSNEESLDDHFGHSVRLIGDFAIITRDQRDGPIEIFKRNENEWTFHQYLEGSEGITITNAGNEMLVAGIALKAFTIDPDSQGFTPRAIENSGDHFPTGIFQNDLPFGSASNDKKEHVKMHNNYAVVSAYFGKVILLRLRYGKWVVSREFKFELDNRGVGYGIAVSDKYVAIQSYPWKVEIFPM